MWAVVTGTTFRSNNFKEKGTSWSDDLYYYETWALNIAVVDRRVWDPNKQEKNWIFSSFTKCFHFLYNFTQCFQTFKKTLFLLTHFLFNSPQEIIVVVIIIILVIVAQCDNRRDGGGQNSIPFFLSIFLIFS